MSKKYRTESHHTEPAEKLLAVLTDPRFVEQRELAQGAVEANAEIIEKGPDKLVIQLDAVEYGRTMTGALDKSKREKSQTIQNWNLKDKSGKWVYKGTHGDRINVSGAFRIVAEGAQACRLISDFFVDVSIPLLGGKIEKMVINEIEKSEPRSAAVVERFLSEKTT
jgi:hypothetical protein